MNERRGVPASRTHLDRRARPEDDRDCEGETPSSLNPTEALALWQVADLFRQYLRARVWWAVHDGYDPTVGR